VQVTTCAFPFCTKSALLYSLENKGYEHLRVDESLVQFKINSAALTAKAAAGTS